MVMNGNEGDVNMRKLYSADHSCCSQCSYCFAKWKELYCRQPLFEKAELKEKEAIIYPCCDGEFFQQNQSVSALKQMAESMEKLYVSISTKNHMDQSMLKSICELNDFLVQNEKGFVKVAVSFAALSIDELEQGTLSYRERLELLAELSRLGLPTSVTLKPVLPFVSNEEYNDILKDCAKLVKRITIGGLYVNRNTAFFKKYIDGKYQTKPRWVS